MPKVAPKAIQIAIPDIGPLISLAVEDALELLLMARKDIEIALIDYVEFEVTTEPSKYTDAKAIRQFISKHQDRIRVKDTSYGKLAIPAVKSLLARGVPPQEAFSDDGGEHSVISYMSSIRTENLGSPILILLEDSWFKENSYAVPENAYLVSTSAFLDGLQELGKMPPLEIVRKNNLRRRRNLASMLKIDQRVRKMTGGTL